MAKVKGFSRYEILPDGRVYSLITNKFRTPVINSQNGYQTMVLIGDDKARRTLYIHRLVAEAYIAKDYGKDFVNHKNEIKTDNRAENLEWCTKAYNNTYNGKTQRCCKPIMGTSLVDGHTEIFRSAREAASVTGANYKNISAVCRGKRPQAGGYKWQFI